MALGDEAEARQAFQEALAASVEAGIWSGALIALVGLSFWNMRQGHLEVAALMLNQVARPPACNQGTGDQAEKLLLEIERKLTTEQIMNVRLRINFKDFDVIVRKCWQCIDSGNPLATFAFSKALTHLIYTSME
jgi:hypothetical protein